MPKKHNMIVRSSRCNLPANLPQLLLNGVVLQPVTDLKLLGIHLDSSLDWKVHVGKVAQRLIGMLRIFHDITRTFPKKILVLIYRSLVESILSYCIEIWGNASYSTLKSLFI